MLCFFPVVTNTVSGDVTRFVYDGDGTRVLREDAGGLTANVGAVEVHISGTERTTTTYYFAGGQRIAMRKDGEITHLHGDHGFRRRKLGSASLATDAGGAQVSEMRRIADDAFAVWGDTVRGRTYGSMFHGAARGERDWVV